MDAQGEDDANRRAGLAELKAKPDEGKRQAESRSEENAKLWAFFILIFIGFVIGCFCGWRVTDYFANKNSTKTASDRSKSVPQSDLPPLLEIPMTASDAYAMQERCANSSKEKFDNDGWIQGQNHAKSDLVVDYESHYSRRTNACLQLLIVVKDGADRPYTNITLTDVLTRKEVGQLYIAGDVVHEKESVTTCYVIENRCKDRDSFDALIRPLFE